MTTSAPVLELTEAERMALEAMGRSTLLPHRVVVQAKGLLLAGEGIASNEIARRCDTTPDAVRRWRSKFDAEGLDGVGRNRPGRGRKPELAPELIEAIVHDTLHTTPADATHWSTRSMADHAGVGKDTVARIWRARNMRPWRVETFKLSRWRPTPSADHRAGASVIASIAVLPLIAMKRTDDASASHA